MQFLDEAFGVGEQVAVPGVAGPAGRSVAGFGDMPTHIDDADREGHLDGL